jgi:hypothetical protein
MVVKTSCNWLFLLLVDFLGLAAPQSGFSLWCKEFLLRNQISVLFLFTAFYIWLFVLVEVI